MKIIRNSIGLLFLLGMLFGAFSGILGAGATVSGMRLAVSEASGTFILSGVESGACNFALFWPQGSNYGFVFLNALGQSGQLPNGLKVDGLTAAEITAILQARGWSHVSARVLPDALRRALGAPSILAAVMSFRGMPTVILAPVILFAPTAMPEG